MPTPCAPSSPRWSRSNSSTTSPPESGCRRNLRGLSTVALDQRRSRSAVVTGAVVALLLLVDNADRALIATSLPLIGEEYGLSAAQLSWVVSGFALTMVSAQIPGGLIADRFGPRRVLTVELVVWAGLAAAAGMSATYLYLLAFRLLGGMVAGAVVPNVFKVLSERTTQRWRTVAAGLVIACNLAAGAVVPLLIAPSVGGLGWRTTAAVVAALCLVAAATVYVVLPRPGPLTTQADTYGMNEHDAVDRVPGSSLAATLRSPPIWGFALLYCCTNMLSFGVVSWMPTYLVQERGVAIGDTGLATVVPLTAMSVTAILGSLVFNRWFTARPRLLVVPALLTGTTFLGLMITSSSLTGFILFQALALCVSGLAEVAIIGTIIRAVPSELTGSGVGVLMTGGQLAGVIAPLMMGVLAESYSFEAAFAFLMATTLASAVGFLFVRGGSVIPSLAGQLSEGTSGIALR
ncbi:MFS transporter [Streptomyces scopuliridis]|uniref:MFS transporter n=1 Tax=Streptomyces scopuliridis TaxID=452529 RepID=UPI0036AAADA0